MHGRKKEQEEKEEGRRKGRMKEKNGRREEGRGRRRGERKGKGRRKQERGKEGWVKREGAYRDSLAFASHLTVGALGLQSCAGSGFVWVVGIRTRVFTLFPLIHLVNAKEDCFFCKDTFSFYAYSETHAPVLKLGD